uniref:Uncharacterized protein n=1 Tax=Panagrolaimus davidi TaxID=227884 RepID=A0A914QME6_9BILA
MSDIVIPNFEKFPQCYQNIVNKLLDDLNSTEDVETQKQLFKSFAENYSMLPECFEYYYDIEGNYVLRKEIFLLSLKHFTTRWAFDLIPQPILEFPRNFAAFIWDNLNEMESELYPEMVPYVTTTKPLKVKEKIVLQSLSFPNKHLLFISKIYEEICGSMTADIREMYLKNVELFQKLKTYFETDSTKFLEITLKIENFVSQCCNIELLLGCHPYDKNIWQFYFKFLQDKNEKVALLDVYRRYCGIFLDDEEIKDKISKLSESIILSAGVEIPTEEELPMTKKELKAAVKNFTIENVAFQPLPFRKPFNNYIYENANGKLLIKLQMATKHFLRTLPFLVIERLEISDEPKNFHKNSLSIPAENELFKKIGNINLSNSLFLVSIEASELIPKVVHCDLKYLRVPFESLKLKEFEFFVQSGNIELLSLHEVIDENEQMVPLEVLLAKTPKIYYIYLFACQLTPQTFQNLLKLEFQTKILYFSLHDILEEIDVESCVKFFKQNLGGNGQIHIDFYDDLYPEDNFVQLRAALNAMKNQWEPADEKPEVDLFLGPVFY